MYSMFNLVVKRDSLSKKVLILQNTIILVTLKKRAHTCVIQLVINLCKFSHITHASYSVKVFHSLCDLFKTFFRRIFSRLVWLMSDIIARS